EFSWDLSEGLAWWALFTLVLGAAWMIVERLVPAGLDVPQSIVFIMAVGGGAAAVAAISTLVIGIHAGAVATAIVVAGLIGWRTRRAVSPEFVATLVPVVAFIWVTAFVVGGVPGTSILLIAAAPILAIAAIHWARAQRRPRMALAVGPALAAIAIASSVLAIEIPAHFAAEDTRQEDDDGSYIPY
ncbi:MAG: hypothetical protein ACNA8W_24995, partial [Bradymonadaceae bacterium]